jgi:hypothetical protein
MEVATMPDPQIVLALQLVEALKQEFSGEAHDPATHSVQEIAHAGERWVQAIIQDRHGISFEQAAASGLYIAKATAPRLQRMVSFGEINLKTGIETSFFAGWWNGLAVGLEYPNA